MPTIIKNAFIVNEGTIFKGSVLLENGIISEISDSPILKKGVQTIDGEGQFLLPGAIDDQVHFREPGLTHKANIYTESRAAVAGGITSFMEMPNTRPAALTQELLEEKYNLAKFRSAANYSFFMGVSNDNVEEVLKTFPGVVDALVVGVPDVAEGTIDAPLAGTVIKLLVKEGDEVKSGDILAEVETDKATMELESYEDGTLLYTGVNEGDSVPVDAIIAIIGDKDADYKALLDAQGAGAPEAKAETKEEAPAEEAPAEAAAMEAPEPPKGATKAPPTALIGQ